MSATDLYGLLPEKSRGNSALQHTIIRAAKKSDHIYQQADKADVVGNFDNLEKLSQAYDNIADKLLSSTNPQDRALGLSYRSKANSVRNTGGITYPRAHDHFTLSEIYDRNTAYSRFATNAIAEGMAGLAGSVTPRQGYLSHVNRIDFPEGISFSKDLKFHMAHADGFSQKLGIKGAHNLDNFLSELDKRNGRMTSITPTKVDGIYRVEYEIPKLDRAGNMTGYKEIRSPKTVYDPKKISDEQMLKMAQQAAAKGYVKNLAIPDRKQYQETINGIKFQIYLDRNTGVIINAHRN